MPSSGCCPSRSRAISPRRCDAESDRSPAAPAPRRLCYAVGVSTPVQYTVPAHAFDTVTEVDGLPPSAVPVIVTLPSTVPSAVIS